MKFAVLGPYSHLSRDIFEGIFLKEKEDVSRKMVFIHDLQAKNHAQESLKIDNETGRDWGFSGFKN